jgi:hypothetical protein
MIHDYSNNKVYIGQINNGTYSQLLTFNLTVGWTTSRPVRCKLSEDERFISCSTTAHQYTNYMMNWSNNTFLSVAMPADNNSINILDTFMDVNQIYTVVDQNNLKVMRYQLTVNGSNFTYSLLDSAAFPNHPRLIAS